MQESQALIKYARTRVATLLYFIITCSFMTVYEVGERKMEYINEEHFNKVAFDQPTSSLV